MLQLVHKKTLANFPGLYVEYAAVTLDIKSYI